jgi:hypothetical protein
MDQRAAELAELHRNVSIVADCAEYQCDAFARMMQEFLPDGRTIDELRGTLEALACLLWTLEQRTGSRPTALHWRGYALVVHGKNLLGIAHRRWLEVLPAHVLADDPVEVLQ